MEYQAMGERRAIVAGQRLENLQCNFLGTYYLLAIHDRCLSASEVLHNYQAEPSAQ